VPVVNLEAGGERTGLREDGVESEGVCGKKDFSIPLKQSVFPAGEKSNSRQNGYKNGTAGGCVQGGIEEYRTCMQRDG
jgi:hypothetical protein